MPAAANPPDDASDAAALRRHADALADAVEAAVAGWARRTVLQRWRQWTGDEAGADVVAAAERAGHLAEAAVVPALRALLADDVDEQRANPLALLRGAVVHPTAALRSLGVPPVARDEQAAALFPDDVYDLSPASFADVDPSLHDPGIAWGAAKAHVILQRRRGGR